MLILLILIVFVIPLGATKRYLQASYDAATDLVTSGHDGLGDPCLEYAAGSERTQCSKCDASRHYYLFLRNVTHTMCGYYRQGETQSCHLRTEDYPAEEWIRQKMLRDRERYQYPSYEYVMNDRTGLGYCRDISLYYMGEFTDMCSQFGKLVDDPGDQTLISIYSMLDPYQVCFKCGVEGWTTETILDYPDLDYKIGACLPNSTGCRYNQFYDATSSSCQKCSDRFTNCAACNLTHCILCLDGFYSYPDIFDYASNTRRSMCVFDSCPPRTCLKAETKECVQSIIANCQMCSQTDGVQKCLMCAPGMTYNQVTYQCETKAKANSELILYVSAPAKSVATSGLPATYDPQGTSPSDPFLFFQEALASFSSHLTSTQLKARILFSKGTHFWFQCVDASRELFTTTTDGGKYADLCERIKAGPVEFADDSWELRIEPMECSMHDELNPGRDTEFTLAFSKLCVNLARYDSRPVISVNDPYLFFNVSGKMVVRNLKFTGVNQFAVHKQSNVNLKLIPLSLCEVTQVPSTDASFKIAEVKLETPLRYQCKDQRYSTANDSTQCIKNQWKQFSSAEESSFSCASSITDKTYFKQDKSTGLHLQRRRALFNVYGFPEHLNVRNAPPELVIEGSDFEWMMDGYEALIYIETSTFWKLSKPVTVFNTNGDSDDPAFTPFISATKDFYFTSGQARGVTLTLKSSVFRYSRFCLGLIFYRPPSFEPKQRSLTNHTHIFMTDPTPQDQGSALLLESCTFDSMNIQTQVLALATPKTLTMYANVIEEFSLKAVMHRGIVINLEDFGGPVEVTRCRIIGNRWHIPLHRQQGDIEDLSLFYDARGTQEYKLSVCDPKTLSDKYLFSDTLLSEEDFDTFERLAVVYISRPRAPVIFTNNFMRDNLGTYGGAITINSPDFTQGSQSSYLVLKGNLFERNMGWVSGNSLYVRATRVQKADICGGVVLEENTFQDNIGWVNHTGGALTVLCTYLADQNHEDYHHTSGLALTPPSTDPDAQLETAQVVTSTGEIIRLDPQKLTLKYNTFTENYSGGPTLFIQGNFQISVDSCDFSGNGLPSYIQQQLYSPYFTYYKTTFQYQQYPMSTSDCTTLQTDQTASLSLFSSRFTKNSEQLAIKVSGETEVLLRDTRIEGAREILQADGKGEITIHRCRILDNRGGLMVSGAGAQVSVTQSHFSGNNASSLIVLGTTLVKLSLASTNFTSNVVTQIFSFPHQNLTVSLESCRFTQNSISASLLQLQSEYSNLTLTGNLYNNTGDFLSVSGARTKINMTKDWLVGSIIKIEKVANINVKDAIFTEGARMVVREVASGRFEGVRFVGRQLKPLENASEFGFLSILDSSNFSITNCTFTNGTAQRGVALYLSNTRCNLSLCTFSHNLATQEAAVLLTASSLVSLTSSTFLNNRALLATSALRLSSSTLTLTSTTFTSNPSPLSTLSSDSFSSLTLTHCTLSADSTITLHLPLHASLSHCLLSHLQVQLASTEVVLSNVTAREARWEVERSRVRVVGGTMGGVGVKMREGEFKVEGGVLGEVGVSGDEKSLVQIVRGQMREVAVLGEMREVRVNGCVVRGGRIEVDGTEVTEIRASRLTGAIVTVRRAKRVIVVDSEVSEGGQMWVESALVEVSGNKFHQMKDEKGGAVYLQGGIGQITSNSFTSNYAAKGGAIYFDSPSNISLSKNNFTNNTANSLQKGSGGAILYNCPSQNCSLFLDSSNRFINNTASHDGGALLWEHIPPINITQVAFYKNNTAPYAPDVGSFPVKLSLTNESQKVAPGESFSLKLRLIDHQNQTYATDSTTLARLKPQVSGALLQNAEVISSNGTFNFSNLILRGFPGGQSLELITDLNLPGVKAMSIPVMVRACEKGEAEAADYTCKECPVGTYSYKPNMTCKECDSNARCYGGSKVAPKEGYWRSWQESERFIECPNRLVCMGGNVTQPMGQCATGYQGILCGECIEGYKLKQEFVCDLCLNRNSNIIQVSLVGAVGLIIVTLFVRSTMQSATQKHPIYSVYLKIFANHLQIVALISNIDFQWPELIQKFKDGEENLTQAQDRLLSFDCLLQGYNTSIPVYYQKLIVYACLPALLAFGALLFWLMAKLCSSLSWQELQSRCTSTLIILFFLIHPDMSKNFLQSFNCIDVDSVFRLKLNIQSICYEGDHQKYILSIVLPALIVWSAGIPLFTWLCLMRNRETLNKMNAVNLTEAEMEDVQRVKARYGFLFQGFKPSAYNWEIIIMVRKLLIVTAAVFFSTLSAELQVLLVLLLLVSSLWYHQRCQPYISLELNRLETYSLLVSTLSLYTGLFYLTGKHYKYLQRDGLNWFFLLCLVVPNLVFIGYWAWNMRIEVLKEFEGRVKSDRVFCIMAFMKREKFLDKYVKKETLKATKAPSPQAEEARGGPQEDNLSVRGRRQRYEVSESDTIREVRAFRKRYGAAKVYPQDQEPFTSAIFKTTSRLGNSPRYSTPSPEQLSLDSLAALSPPQLKLNQNKESQSHSPLPSPSSLDDIFQNAKVRLSPQQEIDKRVNKRKKRRNKKQAKVKVRELIIQQLS